MKRYLFSILCLAGFSLPLSAQVESGDMETGDDSVLAGDTLLADVGFIPESLDANVDSLLRSWHAQYFTKAEEFCHDDEANVYFTDEVIRERLDKLPHIIPMTYNKMVRDCINLYTERRRGLVRYMLGMADFYFPIMEQILAEQDLPLELKYLAVVESALNPMALSKYGASGLWQFMLPTGKIYGLQINSLIDERRDPVKATYAACRYFKDMYAVYGDWHLVLASYNCGPGNVNKAIRRSGGKTDFWKIFPYLPRETRSYVPLFIAAAYIMNHYCDHNLCPVQTLLPLATDTVMINRMLHLEQVSDLLEMDIVQLRALNPQYLRDIVPGHVAPSALKLSVQQTYAFVDKEDTLFTHRIEELLGNRPAYEKGQPQPPTREQITHITASGETLYTIANRYGVTAKDIRKWNGLGSNRVARGKKLRIYVDNGGVAFASTPAPQPAASAPSSSAAVSSSTPPASAAVQPKGEATTYKVKSGDSLYSISRKYPGVTIADLQKANNLTSSNIRPGQVLKIPKG